MTVLMWAVKIYELEFQDSLAYYGILPRTGFGLRGIVLGPFLHGNLEHLVANTIPLLGLGTMVALHGTRVFLFVTVEVLLFSGILVWLCGTMSFHIGASGLVFGYLGYMLTYGWYVKRFIPFVASLLVLLVYGGAVLGVLPSDPHISWYSHLFGFLVGIQCARSRSDEVRQEQQR